MASKGSSGSQSGSPLNGPSGPQTPADAPATATAAKFAVPPEPSTQVMASAVEDLADMFGVGRDLLKAQQEMEEKLQLEAVAANPSAFAVENGRLGRTNILGTGIGLAIQDDQVTGEIVLKVFVRAKTYDKSLIAEGLVEPKYGGIETDVVEIVDPIPYGFSTRERPARCGSSVAHVSVTAGTIGCLVERDNKLLALSNNHILANENDARVGDFIIQPGRADGGRSPSDWIGNLEDFVPLRFGGFNEVDAALAWVDPSRVSPQHHRFTIDPTPTEPRLWMTVKKEGRTTGSTVGMVTDVNAVLRNVGYRNGFANFQRTVFIESAVSWAPLFSQGGDSGSLIVEASTNRPVALLFAGGGITTFANPISLVQQALRINRFLSTL